MTKTFSFRIARRAVVLLLLCVAALFAACGKTDETPDGVDEAQQPTTVTVSFNSNGGSAVAAQQLQKGEVAVRPQDPTRVGYTFAGWTYQGVAWPFADRPIACDVTLDASWQSNAYTLQLDANGGGCDQTQVAVAYGADYTLPTPVRPGYEFAGWYNSENEQEYVGGAWCTARSLTLTARWEKIFEHNGHLITGLAWYGKQNYRDLVLPAEIDGVAITAVGARAFRNCDQLQSVTIPAGIRTIGEHAFFGCTSLLDVYIEDLAAWCGIEFGTGASNPLLYAKNFYINDVRATDVVIPADVKSIGNFAFSGSGWMTGVSLPAGIVSVGRNAFQNCDNLSYTVYDNAKYLGNAANPHLVLISAVDAGILSCSVHPDTRLLADNAFYGCRSLQTLQINAGLQGIGANAFGFCDSLQYSVFDNAAYLGNAAQPHLVLVAATDLSITACTVHPDTKVIGPCAFADCTLLQSITIPSGLVGISAGAFAGASDAPMALQSVTFAPDSQLKFIGANAFAYDTALTGIAVPADVAYIGTGAFRYCTALTDVTFAADSRLTDIGPYAFFYCSALAALHIPAGVTRIGTPLLMGCTALAVLTVGEGNAMYHSAGNCLVETATKTLIAGCRNSVIPADGSVTCIGYDAFCRSGLVGVTIPETVTSIGMAAFAGCALTAVVVPDSVTYIAGNAFADCNALTALTLPFVGASPYEQNTPCLYWIFRVDNNAASAMPSTMNDIGNVTIPASLKKVTITGSAPVRGGAFVNCKNLTTVELSGAITHIGSGVFSYCTALTTVTLPSSLLSVGEQFCRYTPQLQYTDYESARYLGNSANPYLVLIQTTDKQAAEAIIHPDTKVIAGGAFTASAIRNLTIPDGVISVGAEAFGECVKLQRIFIPASVERIGESAFSNYYIETEALSEVIFEENSRLTVISNCAFAGARALRSITLPAGVIRIGNEAFGACYKLQNITIPAAVECIGSLAFAGVTLTPAALKKVSFEEDSHLAVIGNGAFTDCRSLQSIAIPAGVTRIGERAFCNCPARISFAENAAITEIGAYAFYGCWANTITVPAGVTRIGEYAFAGSTYNSGAAPAYREMFNNKLKTILFAEDSQLTEIADYAFQNCYKLQQITIPAGVTDIGQYAFYQCEALTRVSVPANSRLARIGALAFAFCHALEEVEISANLTCIERYTFGGCIKLQNVIFPEECRLESIQEQAFYHCISLLRIEIPASVTEIKNGAFAECYRLVEVYNKSALRIAKGSESNGSAGYFAKDVYTAPYVSKISVDENGCVVYADGETCVLLDYQGTETELTLPAGLTEIHSYALYRRGTLQSVSVPAGVTSIGSRALGDCLALRSIRFDGTKAQWNSVKKTDRWNENTGNYTIICTDGTLPK